MEKEELLALTKKIRQNKANSDDKKGLIKYLNDEKKISDKQYKDYLKNKDTEHILKLGLIAAAGILLLWAISELAKD